MARYLLRVYAGAVLLMSCAMTAYAATPVADAFPGCATTSLKELDRVRGGFSLADGNNNELQVSIGIERAVFIDGVLKVSTKFATPSLGSQIADGQNLTALNILQNGAGNHFIPTNLADLPSNAMNVVQNTLNNQTIANLNIINATVTSRDLLRSMAITSSLKEMLVGSMP
jgi:hypothetical protein